MTALVPLVGLLALTAASAGAEVLTVAVAPPSPGRAEGFLMGSSRRPDGRTLTLDSRSLRMDGRRIAPVTGEFHYSRYPENEWREELLKMRAGGVGIVATYVFWIHHEEVEGQFDWSGRRSLRRFLETCRELGLMAIVRCGPWCHGEVRNGGLPDWVLAKGWKTRSQDPAYLERVRILYREIAQQALGLLWKDGGPVVGIQIENEFRGPAEHLLTLKGLAREEGLDVPLYTRTGWPELATPMPFGEILPLYGAYAEGFWDRELTPMPGNYWAAFRFSPMRTDRAIATDLLGEREAMDAPDVARYPYLTCEIGGGMMSSYHRRICIDPADVESTTLVKLGSGSTAPGYYMYHGGTNPEGRLTTLQESQATAYWNDMPVKGYDFQAPLGEYGQIRPQYHLLRRLHLLLEDFGFVFAGTQAFFPERRPVGRDDAATLRWAVRSDGVGGFLFVNNHERLVRLPAHEGVQFGVQFPQGKLTIPSAPVTVPPGARFVWPFNLDLGQGVRLAWATAQPLCAVSDRGVRTVFFAETPAVQAEFAFDGAAAGRLEMVAGRIASQGRHVVVRGLRAGTRPALQVRGLRQGAVAIVLLSDQASLGLWRAKWLGRDRVFLSKAGLVADGDELRLTSTDPADLEVGVFPRPPVPLRGAAAARSDGVFAVFKAPQPTTQAEEVRSVVVQKAGPPRSISLGKAPSRVAEAPNDADFAQAAVWRILLPQDLDLATDPILRLDYVGDVARVTLDGRLLTDDFYNGRPFEIGLRRHAPAIRSGDLRVEILPLRTDAPIYLAKLARPDMGGADSIAALRHVEIVPRYEASLHPAPTASRGARGSR